MKGRLSRLLPREHVFLFLLLLVAALSYGNHRCDDVTAALGEGEARLVANLTRDSDNDFATTVYLWPEEGFTGVGVQALTDTARGPERVSAWFSRDSLFPAANTAAWWELWVVMYRGSDRVAFRVYLGDSVKVCVSWVTADNLQSVEVVAHGASSWRDTAPPPGCPYQSFTSWTWPRNSPNCTAPPPIKEATPTPRATTSPPTPQATTSPPTPRATTCPPNPLAVAAVVAVLACLVAAVAALVMAADMYRTLQRLVADQNAA